MPVMLLADMPITINSARRSLETAMAVANGGGAKDDAPLYAETLGVTAQEQAIARRLHEENSAYDPVVAVMIGATSGFAYKGLIGKPVPYPIPAFRFPTAKPGRLLDVGCNWGRWTIAAALRGHDAVGIDPQLGSVLAARRVAAQLGVKAHFVVGDARFLPFPENAFDYAWSYSVLQHFSRDDAKQALAEVGRVIRDGGWVRIQMANALGVRSLYHQARRSFRSPTAFDVRYWMPGEMKGVFGAILAPTRLDVDCFLGSGLQWSDFPRMTTAGKAALLISEPLRRLSALARPLGWLADSLFCTAHIRRGQAHG